MMAVAKTQKQIRNGVLSIYFKLNQNFQVLKYSEFAVSAQRHICAWTARNWTLVYSVTSNHLDQ